MSQTRPLSTEEPGPSKSYPAQMPTWTAIWVGVWWGLGGFIILSCIGFFIYQAAGATVSVWRIERRLDELEKEVKELRAAKTP